MDKEGQFMSTNMYRDKLVEQGVDRTGLDVCHIIACSHGGPDHTDNYLFALAAEFNRGIGDRCDALNCYLAGKEKARKAVTISLQVAQNRELHHRVHRRQKGEARLFTEGIHYDANLSASQISENLYKQGGDLMKQLIKAAGPRHNYNTRQAAREAEELRTRASLSMREKIETP